MYNVVLNVQCCTVQFLVVVRGIFCLECLYSCSLFSGIRKTLLYSASSPEAQGGYATDMHPHPLRLPHCLHSLEKGTFVSPGWEDMATSLPTLQEEEEKKLLGIMLEELKEKSLSSWTWNRRRTGPVSRRLTIGSPTPSA
jgi:hypothetical protein